MPTADVNGQTLYYEVHGEGEPLLCVMGLSADTLAWLPQVPAFSAAHRTVIFDNRDVGRSSLADGPYEIADMARDTLALADELGLESFHLVGCSLGGAISQEVAIAAPERVRTLTLAVTLRRRRRVGAQAERGLGRARPPVVARGARGRADAADVLGALLRGRAAGHLAARDAAPEPAPRSRRRRSSASSRPAAATTRARGCGACRCRPT